ncbi:HNH endonuclease signature motif containing protein [Agrobacterium vitis]|uniref:HNH endonuclease signature motif containing protein n=1 Tax=Agrobacterium vitis TaxID=373 RepID=UPI001F45B8A3|nr:HNH endonuclease signature motif containing protein [Agrobacterium vitis]
MIGEVWRVVPSAPAFLASSEGRIMVAPYVAGLPNGGERQYGGEPHFGVWEKTAARFITVLKGKTYKVHRLVCEAFNGPPPSADSVCMHLDENAANNRPSNLQWGTQKENLNFPGFKQKCTERNARRHSRKDQSNENHQ